LVPSLSIILPKYHRDRMPGRAPLNNISIVSIRQSNFWTNRVAADSIPAGRDSLPWCKNNKRKWSICCNQHFHVLLFMGSSVFPISTEYIHNSLWKLISVRWFCPGR
jgi:hypothetical protein